jgi:hypothetical protein
MTASEFKDIAGVLAWPSIAFFAIVLFYPALCKLVESIAVGLRVRTLKLKALGVELELTPEEVEAAAAQLLHELAVMTNGLSEPERSLFRDVIAANGHKTVGDMFPKFVRHDADHVRLGRLRDHQLIRPMEGGSWQKDKRPVPTQFGLLVVKLLKSKQ